MKNTATNVFFVTMGICPAINFLNNLSPTSCEVDLSIIVHVYGVMNFMFSVVFFVLLVILNDMLKLLDGLRLSK